jgi:ATP-dependent DNA helicase RecG
MVVLDPGRFGISQLHQIRGRVGRSRFASRCYLVGDTKTPEGEARLNALVESTDGFYLSEKDLELRGEGTLFSTAQSGQSDLYLANIRDNLDVLEIAKKDAEKILERNSSLRAHPENIFKEEINVLFGNKSLKS